MLGQLGVKFLEGRGISEEVAVRFGIYTASRSGNNPRSDERGNILVFPYTEHGRAVNAKYRIIVPDNKVMWPRPGGRQTVWNADALDDPSLASGHMPLIFTEGEPDALVAIQCGFPLTVSVPNGAPPPGSNHDDASRSFEYIYNNRNRLDKIKRFIIAVDGDAAGRGLADELVRLLLASRCSYVTYPEGTKDLNDVLVKYGSEAVAAVINGAKPYPVRGLYKLSDYPDRGPLKTFSTGWPTVDDIFQIVRGEFIVITGIPSHGKSAWVLHLLVNLAELHGWRSAVFSPEMPTVPILRDTLRRIRSRQAAPTSDEIAAVDSWINQHFSFIDVDPSGNDDEDNFDLDWITSRATDAVIRDGIHVLLVDCWNEIEHARLRGENMTDYIARCIRDLKRFASLYKVVVIVIAHPNKEVWNGHSGKTRTPSLYDIENSAHWVNKPDHGLVIERPDPDGCEAVVYMAKVRFRGTGRKGSVRMMFDQYTDRFEMLNVGQ